MGWGRRRLHPLDPPLGLPYNEHNQTMADPGSPERSGSADPVGESAKVQKATFQKIAM